MTGTSLQTLSLSLPIGSLDAYIARVNQIPMLTQAEEVELAHKLFENQDINAARRLIMAHLRFVVKIAQGYNGYGLALADLIQEGNVGLMKAVKRFNPAVGVRLVSFAVHWIKAEIHEFILRNWRIVKIATTKAQRKLFFNIRKAKKRLGWFSKAEVDSVAQDLGVSSKAVMEMEARLNAYDVAFDGYDDDDGSESNTISVAPVTYLEDKRANPMRMLEQNETDQQQQNLYTALEGLDERSRDILYNRWLADTKLTLHDLAAKYGVSAERVRQLEQNAMKKLKTVLIAA